MASVPTSNMASKQYCPQCKSFDLKRLHRGYLKKVILRQPIQYVCRSCHEHISELAMAGNDVRAVPVFIANQ